MTVAMAESCTGGLISHKITTIPGSSEYFLGGVTAYANSMKITYLNVDQTLIETHGAVSEEIARAMAEGIRTRTGADIGLSVTGIAGPDGGTPEKPVGTVFFGLVTADCSRVLQFKFSGSRDQIQEITAFTGMNLIRKYLLNKNNQTSTQLSPDQHHQLADLG